MLFRINIISVALSVYAVIYRRRGATCVRQIVCDGAARGGRLFGRAASPPVLFSLSTRVIYNNNCTKRSPFHPHHLLLTRYRTCFYCSSCFTFIYLCFTPIIISHCCGFVFAEDIRARSVLRVSVTNRAILVYTAPFSGTSVVF